MTPSYHTTHKVPIVQKRKERFRSGCLKRLKGVRNPYLADKRIVAALHHLADTPSLRSVMLYIPLPIEVDIRPFANALRRAGKRVYVPYMEGESFRLVQYRYPYAKSVSAYWSQKSHTLTVRSASIWRSYRSSARIPRCDASVSVRVCTIDFSKKRKET